MFLELRGEKLHFLSSGLQNKRSKTTFTALWVVDNWQLGQFLFCLICACRSMAFMFFGEGIWVFGKVCVGGVGVTKPSLREENLANDPYVWVVTAQNFFISKQIGIS